MDTNLPNPTILAIVTIHEWQTFTKQCNSHPVVSPEFPSLTIKVEGRSLDLYLGGDGQEPENIGILYTETYSEQTATELEEAIKKASSIPWRWNLRNLWQVMHIWSSIMSGLKTPCRSSLTSGRLSEKRSIIE